MSAYKCNTCTTPLAFKYKLKCHVCFPDVAKHHEIEMETLSTLGRVLHKQTPRDSNKNHQLHISDIIPTKAFHAAVMNNLTDEESSLFEAHAVFAFSKAVDKRHRNFVIDNDFIYYTHSGKCMLEAKLSNLYYSFYIPRIDTTFVFDLGRNGKPKVSKLKRAVKLLKKIMVGKHVNN